MSYCLATIHPIALIPALPLLATILTALLGARYLKRLSHWPVMVATAVSFLLSAMLLIQTHQAAANDHQQADAGEIVTLWSWVHVQDAYQAVPSSERETEDLRIDVVLRVDGLTVVMLTMVTFVSLLVTIFAAGYMHDDVGYWRFFTYIGLFIFSMTMLISVNNFVLLFVFWEAVGMCSYLLIGFWYQKPEAAAAGKKAFLVNRVGDFGFLLALFLIWSTYGTLNYYGTEGARGVLDSGLPVGEASGLLICLLLMLGACGKSAQFPLHIWLPDAMEGPTPVSALIHAATMVTAGVYMVTRCWPLFAASEEAQLAVACIGGFTALLAGLIALTQFDLKRVLAYSTISQLGYMFLALGTGSRAGIVAGMFHLVTHAFFKALLFLGSGSVMHATGTVDMRQFGGLRSRLRITHITFLIGCLALSGFPLLAGFWSKDAILTAVYERSVVPSYAGFYTTLFWVATCTALLTAIYTFRAFFLTFYGPAQHPSEAGESPHESPASMWIPLAILAVGSCLIGLVHHPLEHVLLQTPSLTGLDVTEVGHVTWIPLMSALVALAGIGLAGWFYLRGGELLDRITGLLKRCGLYQLSEEKFYLDTLYWGFIIWPLRCMALICYAVDRWIIDYLVDFCGRCPRSFGSLMRSLQMGLTSFYALAMVLGLLVLMAARLLSQLT